MAEIQVENVSKTYPQGVKALDSVSLDISAGEFLVLVGPSGSGKSTLLRVVAGLEEVSSGTIRIGDRDVTDIKESERDLAMVFQNYALYPHMTVRSNIGFGLRVRKTPKDEIRRRVDEVSSALTLGGLLERKPAELSGGQRQRVAIGRAMVREPKAYLMDEPLSNLDAQLRVAMRAELVRLHARLGVTTIYVTHDQIEAMTLGQRVAVLRDGVLEQCDTPQRLYDHPANVFVGSFIGSPTMNLVEATLTHEGLSFGSHFIPCSHRLAARDGLRVILGVRPHDLALGPGAAPGGACISARLDIVERLGSEANLIFSVDAPRLAASLTGPAGSADGDDTNLIRGDGNRAVFTARVSGRGLPAPGEVVPIVFDTSRLHIFDAQSGAALWPPVGTSDS